MQNEPPGKLILEMETTQGFLGEVIIQIQQQIDSPKVYALIRDAKREASRVLSFSLALINNGVAPGNVERANNGVEKVKSTLTQLQNVIRGAIERGVLNGQTDEVLEIASRMDEHIAYFNQRGAIRSREEVLAQ